MIVGKTNKNLFMKFLSLNVIDKEDDHPTWVEDEFVFHRTADIYKSFCVVKQRRAMLSRGKLVTKPATETFYSPPGFTCTL